MLGIKIRAGERFGLAIMARLDFKETIKQTVIPTRQRSLALPYTTVFGALSFYGRLIFMVQRIWTTVNIVVMHAGEPSCVKQVRQQPTSRLSDATSAGYNIVEVTTQQGRALLMARRLS